MEVARDVEVLLASQIFGEIIARTIVGEHPELDLAGYTAACSAELFLAAQDMKRMGSIEAANLGVGS